MLTEPNTSPSMIRAVGRPAIWAADEKVKRDFLGYCAHIAVRHEENNCPSEAMGRRCFNCRPLIAAMQSPVATHYVTFQSRPSGQQ